MFSKSLWSLIMICQLQENIIFTGLVEVVDLAEKELQSILSKMMT